MGGYFKQLQLKMLIRVHERTGTLTESFKRQRNMINFATLDHYN